MSQQSWLHLAHQCVKIQSLHVRVSPITADVFADEVLTVIAERWKGLKKLRLGGCDAITDQGVAALMEHAAPLESVEFYYCNGVTDNAVMLLTRNCKSLLNIRFNDCKRVDYKAVKQLRKAYFRAQRASHLPYSGVLPSCGCLVS